MGAIQEMLGRDIAQKPLKVLNSFFAFRLRLEKKCKQTGFYSVKCQMCCLKLTEIVKSVKTVQ